MAEVWERLSVEEHLDNWLDRWSGLPAEERAQAREDCLDMVAAHPEVVDVKGWPWQTVLDVARRNRASGQLPRRAT